MSAAAETRAVFVNDRRHELAGGSSLLALLGELGLADRRGVAVAVNGEVVPRSAWGGRALGDRDRVIVIRATQGG